MANHPSMDIRIPINGTNHLAHDWYVCPAPPVITKALSKKDCEVMSQVIRLATSPTSC
jgi:hypothetical protein